MRGRYSMPIRPGTELQERPLWHVFIAHCAADSDFAKRLFRSLSKKYRVFLASQTLTPGDVWVSAIPASQRASLLTAVLISSKTDSSYYEREEIAAAIALSRQKEPITRVVPIYLSDEIPGDTPYGLRQIHAIRGTSVKLVAKKIGRLIKLIEKPEPKAKPLSIIQKTEPKARPLGIQVETPPLPVAQDGENVDGLESVRLDKGAGKALMKRLGEEVDLWRKKREKNRGSMALLLIDVDKLTGINKTFGGQLGDRVLQTIVSILSSYAADYGRCGDDTFYTLYFDCSTQYVARRAEDICACIAAYSWDRFATELHVTCSIGIAELDWSQPSLDWPVRAALGMKLAKQKGGNQVVAGPLFVPSSISRDLEDHYS